MMAGRIHGQKKSLSSMFEAVGSVAAGTMTMEELCEYEEKGCPGMLCQADTLGINRRNGAVAAQPHADGFRQASAKTPNLCHLAPAGPTYMEDLNEAGGVYAVMHVSSHNPAAFDGVDSILLAVKDSRRPLVHQHLRHHCRTLHHAALGSKVSFQDGPAWR